MTAALCQILSNAPLNPELLQQLQTATQSLNTAVTRSLLKSEICVRSVIVKGSGQTTPETSVAYSIASDGGVRVQRTPPGSVGSQGNAPSANPYPHLSLLTAGFSDIVRRAEVLLREKAIRSLSNAVRQLENTSQIDETNLEILIVSTIDREEITDAWHTA